MRAIIALSFALSGCAVALPTGEYSCESNSDCLSGYSCVLSTCRAAGDDPCVDDDEDGYGVDGAHQDCPKCRDEALCEPDCDDSNTGVHPGADDICDGADNNCSGAADERATCERFQDCPPEPNALARCEGGMCAYYSLRELEPGCAGVAMCVNGDLDLPDGC